MDYQKSAEVIVGSINGAEGLNMSCGCIPAFRGVVQQAERAGCWKETVKPPKHSQTKPDGIRE